jgi:hypothetical protein
LLRRNRIGSEESTHGQTDIYYIPPPAGYRGGGDIKVCAVSNFIYTGSFFFGRGEGDLGFFYEKGSKGKKVLLQDMK